jgi:hypothetical protein
MVSGSTSLDRRPALTSSALKARGREDGIGRVGCLPLILGPAKDRPRARDHGAVGYFPVGSFSPPVACFVPRRTLISLREGRVAAEVALLELGPAHRPRRPAIEAPDDRRRGLDPRLPADPRHPRQQAVELGVVSGGDLDLLAVAEPRLIRKGGGPGAEALTTV